MLSAPCQARFVASSICWLVLASAALAAPVTLEFQLHAPSLPEDAAVYVTGSTSGLGNWQPDGRRMEYAGDHRWTYELTVSGGTTIEYKYTLGSWEREGADATGKPLPNFSHTVDGSTKISDRIDAWTSGSQPRFVGQITGTVKYHRQLASDGLRSRDVVVWLPPNYKHTTVKYPVLYMHDGQNLFDPKTSAFGVDWQIDETCTRLIDQRVIAPLIVVGIYNTPERSQEYLPGEKCNAYRNFVINTVKPLIDQTYRTDRSRDGTLVGGSSAGGLCAFMLAWEHSGVFSKAICMSPAFKLENDEKKLELDYVSTVADSARPEHSLTFYIDNGGVGLEKRLQPGVDAMIGALRNQGYKAEQDLFYMRDEQARHEEAAWAKRFPAAITKLLGLEGERDAARFTDDPSQ